MSWGFAHTFVNIPTPYITWHFWWDSAMSIFPLKYVNESFTLANVPSLPSLLGSSIIQEASSFSVHKFINMLTTRKWKPISKICSPDDIMFHKTLSSVESIFSSTLYFPCKEREIRIFILSQCYFWAYFVQSFLLRGKIDFWLLSYPGCVNHVDLTTYTQLKVLLNDSWPPCLPQPLAQ